MLLKVCYVITLSALIIRLLIHNITIAVLQSAPRVVATLCRGGEGAELGLVSSMTSLISPLPVMPAGPRTNLTLLTSLMSY